jgi:hypothetical protein
MANGMSQRNSYLLILISVVVILAIYIVLPTSPGFHIGGFAKISPHVWIGPLAVQALLEADPLAKTVIEAARDIACIIMENRAMVWVNQRWSMLATAGSLSSPQ